MTSDATTVEATPPQEELLTSTALDNRTTLAALICIAMTGPMFFLLMPLYVGALADDLALNPIQIGTLTSLELVGSCLASLSGLFWIRKVNWQKTAVAGALALFSFNLLSTAATDSFTQLTLLRAGAGFSSGCLMAIAVAALSDTTKLERNFGLAVAGQLSLSGVLFFVLPQLITQHGINAVLTLLAGCALLALLACIGVPTQGKAHSQLRASVGRAWRPLWGLAGSTAFFIAQTALWAFIERMGVNAKMEPDFIGVTLGTSTLISIGAALGAGWLILFINRFWLMAFAALGELACLVALSNGFSAGTFFVAAVMFQICWNGWVPIQMANIAAVDASGRFTVLIGLFQAMGVAAGPVLVAQFLSGSSFLPVTVVSGVFVVISVLLFAPIALKND